MLGLRSPDAELRANFFAIIDRAVERTPFARLHHIIEKQDWEPLGPTLWLRQATQLLLDAWFGGRDESALVASALVC